MASQTQDPTLDIQTKYEEFRRSCKTILPKIDHKLIEDFLNRHQEDPGARYSIEVTTKEGLDTQTIKDLVWSKIGEVPDIDNHGTKYRIEHKLSLDALKTLSDYDFVLNIKGSYIGYFWILNTRYSYLQRSRIPQATNRFIIIRIIMRSSPRPLILDKIRPLVPEFGQLLSVHTVEFKSCYGKLACRFFRSIQNLCIVRHLIILTEWSNLSRHWTKYNF